jgi:DNA-binding NarL/FixJ family response regulator
MNSSSKKGEPVLTSREREILRHIVNGKSNRQIAAELRLSVNTVRVHRANIMAAVGIHKSTQLVVYAMRIGLVAPPGHREWE